MKIEFNENDNVYYRQSPEMFMKLVHLIEEHPVSYGQMLRAKGKKKFVAKHPDYVPKYKELHDWINNSLPMLSDPFYKISTKCHWIINGFTDFPKCTFNGCEHKFIYNNVQVMMPYPRFCLQHCKCDPSTIEKRKARSRIKFGVDFPMQSEEVKRKVRQTNIKNLGYPSPLSCPKCQELAAQTKLNKYGDPNWHNTEKAVATFKRHAEENKDFIHDIREKIKQTNIKNGHCDNWTNREKAVQTRLENHDGNYITDDILAKCEATKNRKRLENPNYDKEIQDKIRKTNLERHGSECIFQSEKNKEKLNEWIIRHGGQTNVFQTDVVKRKSRQTMQTKYNADCSMHSDEIKAKYDFNSINSKGNETKRKNGTFNTSKPEDQSYQLLCEHFSEEDVLRQHHSDKYPYNCDFYVKSLDLWIECNYNWTHGGHFFDPACEDDQNTLQKWRDKNTKFYNIAIDVWTRRDPQKLKTAKDNDLKYIVFWKVQELINWLASIDEMKI